jgi:prepilin-type N-terminal cleavage/methylation domain-containing protein
VAQAFTLPTSNALSAETHPQLVGPSSQHRSVAFQAAMPPFVGACFLRLSVEGTPSLSRSRRGVTLVEMVVVVAIIALIVGLSFPAASAGLDNVRMVSAGDSVATFLNAAVNRAERHQQPVELVISPQEGRLTLYSNEPGFTRELKMPDGVWIEAVLPAEEGGDPAQPRRILFLPGATVPGIAIQLGNRRNAHRRVRLDPMTGFPRVESVEIQ